MRGLRQAPPLFLVAVVVTGCGSATGKAVDRAAAPTSSAPVISSVSAHRAGAPIDLRHVVVRTTDHQVTADFTTYDRLDRAKMTAPYCGLVGLYFRAAHVTVQSSAQFQGDSSPTRTPKGGVSVAFVRPHLMRIAVARTLLGSRFTPTTPWVAFSDGPLCPPLDVAEDSLPAVTPRS